MKKITLLIERRPKAFFILLFALVLSKQVSAQNSFPSSGDAILGSGNALIYDHLYSVHGYTKYDYIGLPEAAMLNYGYYGHRFATRQGGTAMVIRGDNNYVGLGVTSPAQRLDVAGAIQTSGDAGIVLANSLNYTNGSGTVYAYLSRSGGSGSEYPWNSNGTVVMQASSFGNTGGFAFITGDSPSVKMNIVNNGNVGIGTTTPDSKLTVAGKIHSQEVKVTATAGADFVFEDDYKLRSLAETESFIKANKHLPEIASANEMVKNGIELGEMNLKLLQKIEELTLHLIEQSKEIKEQGAKIKHLEGKILQPQAKL